MARGRSLISKPTGRDVIAPLIPVTLSDELPEARDDDSVEIVLRTGDRVRVRGRLAGIVARRLVRLLEADR